MNMTRQCDQCYTTLLQNCSDRAFTLILGSPVCIQYRLLTSPLRWTSPLLPCNEQLQRISHQHQKQTLLHSSHNQSSCKKIKMKKNRLD